MKSFLLNGNAIKEFSVDIKKIKYILNTHNHRDHFNIDVKDFLVSQGAEFIKVNDEMEFKIGNYKIKAVKGHHRIPTMHYFISDEKTRIFYGLDGAWLMYNEVQAIKEHMVDFAVLDGTIGFIDGDYRIFEHNNLNMVIEMKKSLKQYVKRFCISHMAYTLHSEHKTLVSEMEKYDIDVAFDGLEIEV